MHSPPEARDGYHRPGVQIPPPPQLGDISFSAHTTVAARVDRSGFGRSRRCRSTHRVPPDNHRMNTLSPAWSASGAGRQGAGAPVDAAAQPFADPERVQVRPHPASAAGRVCFRAHCGWRRWCPRRSRQPGWQPQVRLGDQIVGVDHGRCGSCRWDHMTCPAELLGNEHDRCGVIERRQRHFTALADQQRVVLGGTSPLPEMML